MLAANPVPRLVLGGIRRSSRLLEHNLRFLRGRLLVLAFIVLLVSTENFHEGRVRRSLGMSVREDGAALGPLVKCGYAAGGDNEGDGAEKVLAASGCVRGLGAEQEGSSAGYVRGDVMRQSGSSCGCSSGKPRVHRCHGYEERQTVVMRDTSAVSEFDLSPQRDLLNVPVS